MKPKFTLRDLFWPVLVTSLAIPSFQAAAQDQPAATPDFSRYEQTEALKFYIDEHTRPGAYAERNWFLLISDFHPNDKVVLQYFVARDGKTWNWRHCYSHATQATHTAQLSQRQLEQLRMAIEDLSAENATPPLEQLVLVTFRKGKDWIVRSYDQKDLPKAMRRIHAIIGEREEVKREK